MQEEAIKNLNAEIPGMFTSGRTKGDKWDNYTPPERAAPRGIHSGKDVPYKRRSDAKDAPRSKSPS